MPETPVTISAGASSSAPIIPLQPGATREAPELDEESMRSPKAAKTASPKKARTEADVRHVERYPDEDEGAFDLGGLQFDEALDAYEPEPCLREERPPELAPEELKALDLVSDRKEIERLLKMGVMAQVSEEEAMDPKYSWMSTTVARDWRWREQRWQRRSRLVARDYKAVDPTREGLFSPAAGVNLARVVPFVAMMEQQPTYVLDIKDAYLMCDQPRPVLISAPSFLPEFAGQIWELKKLLPGQRDGSSVWFGKALGLLREAGLDNLPEAPNIFRGVPDMSSIRLTIHVDDVLFCGCKEEVNRLLEVLEKDVLSICLAKSTSI